MNIRTLFLFILLAGLSTSCVSKKTYKALEAGYVASQNELQNASQTISKLKRDTLEKGKELRLALEDVNNLQKYNQYAQSTLINKVKQLETTLAQKEFALVGRDRFLEEQKEELEKTKKQLERRNKQAGNIRNTLKEQNAALDSIHHKISTNLSGFGEDVSVDIRSRQVVVSLSEELMFRAGNISVRTKGKEALGRIAEILRPYSDIEITVVGHTDNRSASSGLVKDNWDFSVLRAAAATRELVDQGLYPWRLMPIGRADNVPVVENSSSENRTKNRRLEIIVRPNPQTISRLLEENF